MRSIKELLELEKQGKPLTEEERRYLDRYKTTKRVRHSDSFVYHSRKLPDGDSVKRA